MPSTQLSAPLRMVLALRPACQRTIPSAALPRLVQANNPMTQTAIRNASHAAQGRANGVKNGPGKRLGAKKTGGQQVVPGNIIFRQRGTHWFPGENCAMGRDHTIYATEPGYVTYYRDPNKHPKRQYIGVVFQRTQTLPTPLNAARRRRLGMVAVRRRDLVDGEEGQSFEVNRNLDGVDGESYTEPTIRSGTGGEVPDIAHNEIEPGTRGLHTPLAHSLSSTTAQPTSTRPSPATPASTRPVLEMRSNYMYREANWSIGRTAEREGLVDKVRTWKRDDRFLAWRKAAARIKRNAEKRNLGRGGKAAGKGKKKK